MVETKALVNAVMEIASEKGKQYAEDCVKGMLKMKKVTTSQYFECMEALYE